jgi:hypothetical protein
MEPPSSQGMSKNEDFQDEVTDEWKVLIPFILLVSIYPMKLFMKKKRCLLL